VAISDGAAVSASTTGPGNAGNITIQGLASPAQSVVIDGSGSGIFTNASGSGAGGSTHISTQSLTIQNGGSISAATSGTAPSAIGGTITVNATNQVTLTNGGSVTASSTGPGDAGNISLNAGQQLLMQNASITTEAARARGGNITVQATDTVQLTNSQINTSVQGAATTTGGNITIDPQFVILQNSQILTTATQGQGGNINITITNGGLFLPDSTSRVSASSEFGQHGTITIQSPNAPAGGKIQPLGKTPLQVTALLSQRCAAIARGEVSSFVMAGRDTLPTEPGGWLPSPLALGPLEAGAAVQAGDRTSSSESSEPTILSLRRLPSPSKVAQMFSEEDWISGCETS
jgi:large exoprotein involved in heme utilization and adhesion